MPASQALLDEDKSTSAESSQVLHQLMKLAAQAGHELRVDAQVWEQLAWSSDAQQRVQRLESVFAEGPEGAVLAGLLPPALRLIQALASQSRRHL
jgi:phosphotransferase system HPr-like phosphotransfer protein